MMGCGTNIFQGLGAAALINGADLSLIDQSGKAYTFTFAQLLQFMAQNLSTGSEAYFGTAAPQNTQGNNNDTFLNTATGTIYQKANGAWSVQYSFAAAGDGALLFNQGAPTAALGKNGDACIDTLAGIYYQKKGGAWVQAYSTATGPQGAPGPQGTPGAAGANGNTILSGASMPSNTIGYNGDYFLNTNTYQLYGPKTSGAWGSGISLIAALPPQIKDYPVGTPVPITLTGYQTLYAGYGNYPGLVVQEITGAGTVKHRTDIQPASTYINGLLDSISLDVPADSSGKSVTHYQLIIKV